MHITNVILIMHSIIHIDNKWHYKHGAINLVTFFNWKFEFGFQVAKRSVRTNILQTLAAFSTPIMIGGIFAISRRFYEQIHGYDEELLLWGGENIDLSFKAWLSGGRVVNAPCSRIAHVENKYGRRYREGRKYQRIIQKNYRRLVDIYFKREGLDKYIDINLRKTTNNQLKYEKYNYKYSMSWYFNEIYPELGMGYTNSLAFGGLMNLKYNKCLSNKRIINATLDKCNLKIDSEDVFWEKTGRIRTPTTIFNYNIKKSQLQQLDAITESENLRISTFIHWQNGHIIDIRSGLCVDIHKNISNKDYKLEMNKCNYIKKSQLWKFKKYKKDKFI